MVSPYRCEEEASLLTALHQLVPRVEMHAVLDNLATGRIGTFEFADFVCHTMAKAAAEQIFNRHWKVIDRDSRKEAARMAMTYVMHCIYEQTAAGMLKPNPSRVEQPERRLGKVG